MFTNLITALMLTILAPVPHAPKVFMGSTVVTAERAQEIAIDSAAKAWHLAPKIRLRAARREDLEEEWLEIASFPHRAVQKDFYFFQVSFVEAQVSGSSVLASHPMSGRPSGLAAVSVDSGRCYLLADFPNEPQFNAMLEDTKVFIDSSASAEGFALTYAKLTMGENRLIPRILNLRGLKQLAQDKFYDFYRDESKADERFESWWSRFKPEFINFSWDPPTEKDGTGFEVEFYTLSTIDKTEPALGPALMKVTLTISPNGHVGKPVIRPVKVGQ
jgi:hypothetical protein